MASWQSQWLTRWDEVWDPTFLSVWRSLMEESPTAHVFFDPTVVRVWVDAYRQFADIEPRFLVARRGSDTAFLPLVQVRGTWKEAWRRVIIPVGHEEFDYHDPILASTESPLPWSSFWSAFAREWEGRWRSTVDLTAIFHLRTNTLPADARIGLAEAFGARLADAPAEIAPYLDLSTVHSMDDLLRRVTARHRQEVARKLRRLEAAGAVRLHRFGPDDSSGAKASVQLLLAHHARRWPGSWRAPGFYENLVRDGLRSGVVRLAELQLDGRPISWQLTLHHRDRFYGYLAAYDPALADYSPGLVHLYYSIEQALREGTTIFDFLRGSETYKRGWATDQSELWRLSWNTNRMVSRVRSTWCDDLRPRLQAAMRRQPVSLGNRPM